MLVTQGHPPRGMIWAARAYDGSGQVVDGLDKHYTRVLKQRGDDAIGRRQRPRIVRIVRTGNVAVTSASRHESIRPIAPRRITIHPRANR